MVKISALPAAGPLDGSEDIPILQAGETRAQGSAPFLNLLSWQESTNLLDPDAYRVGKYINTGSGNIANDAAWTLSGWIKAQEGDEFTIGGDGPRESGIGFYSAQIDVGACVGVSTGDLIKRTVVAPPGTEWVVFQVKSAARPIPANLRVNRGATLLPFEPYFPARYGIAADALRASGPQRSRLVLAGPGAGMSFVESNRSGHKIRNAFVAFPDLVLTAPPCRLNLRELWLDDVLVHAGADDIAPDRIWGDDIGANHGFKLNESTCMGHGKTADDEGSLWLSGGQETVLVKVVDANKLLLARRTANFGPAAGTFTHVSGAAHTADFTTTATSNSIQWRPPHTNYNITVLVDGQDVGSQEGAWDYADSVQIVETCDILARPEIIEWWIANGGASAGMIPEGDPSYTLTTTYHFDRNGQLSIYWQWLFLKETPVTYLRGLQLQANNNPVTNYIPSCLPIVYDGNPVDYAMGASATLTAGKAPLQIGAAALQADGEYGERVIVHWADHAIAAGILPVGDADPAVRRARVANNALEISDESKIYWRVLDIGLHNAQPGDSYSAVAYRHAMPRWEERTSFYTVYTQGRVFIFADWHDRTGVDRLPIDAALSGRSFTVVASVNAAVTPGILTGSLPVPLDAEGDHASLVIEVGA